jgi:uncharacterized membrane protein YsdA (DUF1294 family)
VSECIGRNLLFTVIGDWLLVSGIVGFFAMGLDKARAGNGDWRISEMTLYHFAGGGSLGVALGSCAFHHKTSKASFSSSFTGSSACGSLPSTESAF